MCFITYPLGSGQRLYTSYMIDCLFINSVVSASQITHWRRRQARPCTSDRIMRRVRTSVVATAVAGLWELRYVSFHFTGLDTQHLIWCERQKLYRQTSTTECQGGCCHGDYQAWCWTASSLLWCHLVMSVSCLICKKTIKSEFLKDVKIESGRMQWRRMTRYACGLHLFYYHWQT